MNNKGFTLVEALAVLVVIGIVFGVSFYIVRGTMASTLTQMDEASDNQIFDSARAYILEGNKVFNSQGYVCVNVQELIDYGYVKNIQSSDRIVKIIRNEATKVIEEIKYVDICN